MDKIQNLYSGPVTVQGANIQSHYVPAEKPYAVYAYVWEGPQAAIAQLIGNILVGKVDEKGNIKFHNKAVYRMPQKSMLDFDHCFVPHDMADMENDPIHIGFVGDTVGKDTLVGVIRMVQKFTESNSVVSFFNDMKRAGLNVEIGEESKMNEVTGFIESEYDDVQDNYYYFLSAKKEIALRATIWTSDRESEKPYNVLSDLWKQINGWQEVGVTFEQIKMNAKVADYQDQVDELLNLARLYGECEKKQEDEIQVHKLLMCLDTIGKAKCNYKEYVKGMKKTWFSDYKGYDDDLESAIKQGFASRDGDIIQFSPEFERMASWKWVWKHGEDQR